jgi:hypothetical protein
VRNSHCVREDLVFQKSCFLRKEQHKSKGKRFSPEEHGKEKPKNPDVKG